MKRNIIFWAVAAFFLIVGCVSVSAQQRFEIRFGTNVNGATIFMDNRVIGTSPFTATIAGGTHTFRASIPGYRDAEKTVTISNHTSVYIELQKIAPEPTPRPTPTPAPTSFELKVSSNVRGAQVYVDNRVVGSAPVSTRVTRGSHQVRVTASGYNDYNQNINVYNDMSINADLQRQIMYYMLSISANVQQAKVYLNGREQGYAPKDIKLEAGRYDIRVEKPGYETYNISVDLNRDMRINAELRSRQSTITIVVPDNIINRNGGRPEALIQVLVDGRRQNSFTFTVESGRHRIRIESGGLAIEKDIDARDGRSYTLRLGFDMAVTEQ